MDNLNEDNKIKLPELLAPAGSMDSFIAAVESGADAVYVGAKDFSARHFADNFSDKDLAKAVKYAHLRNTKVYLALNTLIFDEEFKSALEVVYKALSDDVDAFIIQDIGIASKIVELMPQAKLHASTQMTIHNYEGVNLLKKIGFSRIVLARELSLNQVADITERSRDGIEIEIFVHGALCVSFSGQCLFSSMVGGRSGNRGRCAQPCRQTYSLVDYDTGETIYDGCDGSYLLSTKDLCTLEMLPDFVKTGIHSLKIEGRMKNPEYVATVTRIYRKYLDFIGAGRKYIVQESDINDLKVMFNRGGFTKGFLGEEKGLSLMSHKLPSHAGIECGKVTQFNEKARNVEIELSAKLNMGDVIKPRPDDEYSTTVTKMMINEEKLNNALHGQTVTVSTSQRWKKNSTVFKVYDKKLIEKASNAYSGKYFKKVPLYGDFKLSLGNPIEFTILDDEGIKYEIKGVRPAEEAKKAALTPEKVLEQLESMGNTPFYLDKTKIEIEDGLFLPVSELNEVRRKAIELVTDGRIESRKKVSPDEKTFKNALSLFEVEDESTKQISKPKLSVFIPDFELINSIKSLDFARVYIPADEFFKDKITPRVIDELVEEGKEVFIAFPRIVMKSEMERIYENIKKIENYDFSGALIGNLGLVKMFKILDNFKIHGDFSLNIFNRFSLESVQNVGIDSATLSPELEIKQVVKILSREADIDREILVHGRVPLMISRYCATCGLIKGKNENKFACNDCKTRNFGLKDRTSVVFPMKISPDQCRYEILNSKVMCMAWDINSIKNINAQYFRLNFSDEKEEEIANVIKMYSELINGDPKYVTEKYDDLLQNIKAKGFTRGHYFRGIE